MYALEEIRTVHLEVSTKCNARCPMCLRTILGGKVNPHLPLTELSLADVKAIFTPEFIRQLRKMYMCGNYGDPMMAQDTLEIFRYFRECNSEMDLEMFTNGSGRTEQWWSDLAKVVTKCRFSIDGLESTNHIYRRGTKWGLIERALTAFISAGGRADWDFIVFKHNEHQIEEAREYAAKIGVRKFNVKKTGRFFSNTQATGKDQQEVLGPDGEIEYFIEPPINPQYRNQALAKEAEIIAQHGSMKEFLAKTPIVCKVAEEKSVYVTAEGHAFPCCWTANQLYPWYYGERGAPIWKMINQLPNGIDSLNAVKHGLRAVVEGPFFQKRLPESWEKTSYESGRLFVCGKTCGKGFDAFKAQFQEVAPQST